MGSSREISNAAEAESVAFDEGYMYTIAMRDRGALPWSKAILRMNSYYWNLGGLILNHKTALVRIGKTRSRSR